jgi:hypothetical protein
MIWPGSWELIPEISVPGMTNPARSSNGERGASSLESSFQRSPGSPLLPPLLLSELRDVVPAARGRGGSNWEMTRHLPPPPMPAPCSVASRAL